MNRVFISYSREDAAFAHLISDFLQQHADVSVFLDSQVLVAGESWEEQIVGQLREADTVLVLLSEHSHRSKWVQKELEVALESGDKRIIPILLGDQAKENWVWPLISDRQGLHLPSGTQQQELLDELRHVFP